MYQEKKEPRERSVVEESKPKDPSANPKPQSSELVDEVFSLFKGYLNTKLEAQGKLKEGQSKIQKSASEFRFKGNRKQFEFNAKLQSLLSRIKANADDPSQVNTLVQEAEQFIRKRQKLLIKIADRSMDGWLVVQEYESDDLTSNSEDEKRLKKAKNGVEKKRKISERSKLVSSKRFKSDNDNQLFRGNIFLLSSLLCYFSLGWNVGPSNHQIALFVLYVLHSIGKYNLRSFQRSELERNYLKSI